MEVFGFQSGGAGISPADLARITTLENNEYKITYYEIVSGTSGSLTIPSQATINSGEFGLSGNCVLSKIDGSNKPTFESPKTAGGTVVTASLNETTGAWVASDTYTDANVALIYSIKIKAINYGNLTYDNIIETVDDIPTVDTTIIDGSTNAVSGNAVFDGLASKVGIESMIINPGGTLNPADATTYYFGSFISTAATTAAAARRVYLGKDCSIIGATFSLLVSGTLGTSEDINVYIRVNNTTDYSIGTIKANSGTQQILINTSMSVVLTSTDYFEIKLVMPTFATNPVNVSFSSVVNIR